MHRLVLAGFLCGACALAGFGQEVKGPGSPTLQQAPALTGTDLGGSDIQASIFESPDGSFGVLRLEHEGAAGVRLLLDDVHIQEGVRIYVYGLDGNGNAVDVQGPYRAAGPLQSGDFWTNPVRGSVAVVEVQWEGNVTTDIPFRVAEIAGVPDGELQGGDGQQPENAAEPVIRTSLWRGLPVTHEVRDGLAIAEGDVILGPADEMMPATAESKSQRRKSIGLSDVRKLWPAGVIPYTVDPLLPNPSRVQAAVNHWNTQLAGTIRLIPRTSEPYYIKFVRTTAYNCYSYFGMNSMAAQPVRLHDACSVRNIIHEIGHAVGLLHEHVREDRDKYVKVLWQNIQTGQSYNFNQSITTSDDIGSYDYSSIMHYAATAYSANGLATLQTIPAGIPIGQSYVLSAGDIAGVRRLYTQGAGTASSTTTVTVSTNYAGMPVSVDGQTISGPTTFSWVPSSMHTIAAAVPAASDVRYAFVKWSDGGAATHSVVAPNSAATLTATYAAQYRVLGSASGGGTVALTPATADGYVSSGLSVTASAKPAAGYCFTGWTGALTSTAQQLTFVVTKPYSVLGTFQVGATTVPASVTVPDAETRSAFRLQRQEAALGAQRRTQAG